MRVKLDEKLNLTDTPGEESMWMWYEVVSAVYEYAENRMIIRLHPNTFLFLNDWEPVQHFVDKIVNPKVYCIKPLPDFDE